MYLGSDALALAPLHRPRLLSGGRRLGRADPQRRRRSSTATGRRVDARRCIKSAAGALWSTRAIIATSWRRRSTSSRTSSATRSRLSRLRRAERRRLPGELPFDLAQLDRLTIVACGTAYLCRAGRANTGSSSWRACRSKSTSRPSSATARRRCAPKALAIFVSQSGETADTLAALRYCQGARAATLSRSSTCRAHDRARERRRAADPGRAGDRRRLDQGLHLPARGARAARHRGRRAHAASSSRRGREASSSRADRGAAPDRRSAQASRTRSRRSRARSPRRATCSISAAAPAIRSRWKAR